MNLALNAMMMSFPTAHNETGNMVAANAAINASYYWYSFRIMTPCAGCQSALVGRWFGGQR